MSALILTQSISALIPGLTSSFLASGGLSPYTYSVRANGAGGVIDSASGLYTAPPVMGETPDTLYDTIQVKDHTGTIATATILVGNYALLFCDIIKKYLNLDDDHIYLWDQKLMQPTDSKLYVAISVPRCKPFASNKSYDGSGGGLDEVQTINMQATVDIDIISRGPAARDKKELVVLALNSTYSEQQQEINSFQIAKLPPNASFVNLSLSDGAAIPYRYRISVNMQYAVTNKQAVSYFTSFAAPTVSVNP